MVSPKVKKWLEEKRDPRSAHWQAGLEDVMALFMPVLERGRLIPVREVGDEQHPLFQKALARVDINPGVWAAFLPESVANALVPPECAEETLRIESGKASCKIIILRPGEEDRIMCAEISGEAYKPGIDIFQSGALLGTYDYENSDDCLDGLDKAVKAHTRKKDPWRKDDYLTYTLNWFERVMFLENAEVSLDRDHSFFHSPTCIGADRVDALFLLLTLTLENRYRAEDFPDADPILAGRLRDRDSDFCRTTARGHILGLLNQVKDLGLMDFSELSERENRQFQNEFERTEEKLRDLLMHLKA